MERKQNNDISANIYGVLIDPFTVSESRSTVNVHHVGHGRGFGEIVLFKEAVEIPGTGMVIEGQFEVRVAYDDDHYAIEHSVASMAGGRGGGAVKYEYVANDQSNPDEGCGFGEGGFGESEPD